MTQKERTGDGRHVGYLSDRNRAQYEPCDADLYRALQAIIAAGVRNLECVEQAGLFGEDTVFFKEPLTLGGLPWAERDMVRQNWLDRAVGATEGCELIFLDPDNGLVHVEPAHSWRKLLGSHGPKYVALSEIRRFFGEGRSVVVYHHLNRLSKHGDQVERLINMLRERVTPDAFGFWFRRGTGRLFAVLPVAEHRGALGDRAESFAAGPWAAFGHFCPVGL